jgi:WD40 repeat protein
LLSHLCIASKEAFNAELAEILPVMGLQKLVKAYLPQWEENQTLIGIGGSRAQLIFINDRTLVELSIGKIQIWQLDNGDFKLAQTITQDNYNSATAISPDGKYLAFETDTYGVEIWHLKDNIYTYTQTLAGEYPLERILLSQHGNYMCTQDINNEIHLWKLEDHKFVHKLAHQLPFENELQQLAISESADILSIFAIFLNGQLRIWHVNNANIALIQQRQVKYLGEGDCIRLALSPDGKYLALKKRGQKTIQIWPIDAKGVDVAPLQAVAGFGPGAIGPLVFSLDSQKWAVATHDNKLAIWEFEKDKFVFKEKIELPCVEPISLAFSPNGLSLALINRDGTITIWKKNK